MHFRSRPGVTWADGPGGNVLVHAPLPQSPSRGNSHIPEVTEGRLQCLIGRRRSLDSRLLEAMKKPQHADVGYRGIAED